MRRRINGTRGSKYRVGKTRSFTDRVGIYETQRLELERRAVELKMSGHTVSDIAKALEVAASDVPPMLLAGFEEYRADRDDAITRYVSLATARYEKILQEWWPRAQSKTVQVELEDGSMGEVTYPGDPEATKIVLKIHSDMSKMLGLNKMRVEHTGKNGGAIEATIDLKQFSSDQLEKIIAGDHSPLYPSVVHPALSAPASSENHSRAETPRRRKNRTAA